MPAQLATRFSETEYRAVVNKVNVPLQALTKFSSLNVLSLFLMFDLFAVGLLTAIGLFALDAGPSSPRDEDDLGDEDTLALALQLGVLLASFPLVAWAVQRRTNKLMSNLREVLDNVNTGYGSRGVSWQLKQGTLNNGGTKMWVEVQIIPVIRVKFLVPVHVPVPYPMFRRQLLPQPACTFRAPAERTPSSTPGAVPVEGAPEGG